MRRASILVSVVIAVLLGAVAVGRLGTTAQDGTPAAPAGQGFVGSWRIAASSGTGQQVAALASMTSDRIFLGADAPVVAAEGRGAFTYVELETGEGGTPLGLTTIRGTMVLDATGDAWSGEYAVTGTDPGGAVVFADTGTHHATRIVVEPMGTPMAGTPAP